MIGWMVVSLPQRSVQRCAPAISGSAKAYFVRLAAWISTNSASGCATMVANIMPLMMSDQAVSQ
ncbi:hypothetical protein XH88_07665 [Bradyrhizobium sp. CCBAU 51627]|nr:hypothetical protein [Bradyrhizobium sp. CCBAU 51627]